jgi:regulator of RNase E activity RraA
VLDTALFPLDERRAGFIGPAYTVEGGMQSWSQGGDRDKLAAIDAMEPGAVAVWAGNDIRGVCCFGDLLATAMQARGIAGTVVDGGVRDSGFLEKLGLPLRVRYRTPAQAVGRWKVTGCQGTVHVRGALRDWVEVRPGDLVVMDEDGGLVVPAELVEEVAGRVVNWSEKDSSAREDIARGMRLLEALDKYGHL